MEWNGICLCERNRERKRGGEKYRDSILEDSEDFYRSLNWIEMYDDYHWYYEICRNLML